MSINTLTTAVSVEWWARNADYYSYNANLIYKLDYVTDTRARAPVVVIKYKSSWSRVGIVDQHAMSCSIS